MLCFGAFVEEVEEEVADGGGGVGGIAGAGDGDGGEDIARGCSKGQAEQFESMLKLVKAGYKRR